MPPSRAQRAKTAERRSRAVALRLAGADLQQIVDALGYSDKAAASKDITRALEAHLAEQRMGSELLRETELLRLDRIQRGLWPAAVNGDTKAADTVLRVIDRRVRLLGLDIPPDMQEQLRQQVVQAAAAHLFAVINQILDGLGLSADQRELVPDVVRHAVATLNAVAVPRQIEGEMVA